MKKSNQTGGKNHKKYKKVAASEEPKQILRLADKYQVYAIVKKKCGGSRLSVLCSDDKLRSAIIPGKMYKKVWFNEYDIILCDLNTGGDDKQCYITHKYTAKDAAKLKELNHITFEEVGSHFEEQKEEEKKSHKDMFPHSSSEEDKPLNYNHIKEESSVDESSESIDLNKL